MSKREVERPTIEHKEPLGGDGQVEDKHPAFGFISASRYQVSPPGSTLFDSDIQHSHTVAVRIATARRTRSLNSDHIMADKEFVEVEMSEAQWASFVSSMNSSGTPCTIRRREDEHFVPGLPHEPRLGESMEEVRNAGNKAIEKIREAFKKVEEKPNKGNIKHLGHMIDNAPSNMKFAAESLAEHTENVVQKARADIEAMVRSEADRLGLEPGDLGGTNLLGTGEEDE